MTTTVVNIQVVGDIPGVSYDVYIGRGNGPEFKWGNPYKRGRDGSLRTVLQRYREHVLASPELMSALHELKGKTLGCFCAPSPCHGDVLVDLVEHYCP